MLKGKNFEITKKNILSHELIGLKAGVAQSSDENKKKVSGMVVDETKNIIFIEAGNVVKQVPKKEAVFEFLLGDEKVLVDGKKILFRPEDRVKVFWRHN